jgi:predicted GNAT family N-acyltransferase
MIKIDLVDWHLAKNEIRLVREKVFIIEQGIEDHLVDDGKDETCFHVIARDRRGKAIGTGRLSPTGHIGRISVTISYRGQGIGNQILNVLMDIARENHMREVHLNSQTHALGFYEKAGFKEDGPVFMEAGIPHKRMNYAGTS